MLQNSQQAALTEDHNALYALEKENTDWNTIIKVYEEGYYDTVDWIQNIGNSPSMLTITYMYI